MKKFLLVFAITFNLFAASHAQNLLSKIPATSSMVIKYSGENFSRNLPLKKLDTYNFVKENLFKTLKIDTLTSLQNIGINFEKDTYQYITLEDSAMSFVSLINLQNVQQFLQLVQANYHAEMKPEKKNGFEFLSISSGTYIGWNQQQAVLVVTTYQNPNKYYNYPSATDTTSAMIDSAAVVTDSAMVIPPPPPIKKPMIKKPGITKKKPGTTVNKYKKGTHKKPAVKKKTEEVIEEIVEDLKVSYEDSVANAKRDDWYKEQEKITETKQRMVAENIINNSFNSNINSIENDISYKKTIDPAAQVTAWVNYENILRQYWSYFFKGFSPRRLYEPSLAKKSNTEGFRSAVNIYFEKDKMRLEQKSYSPDEQMAALGKEVYNSKQSSALTNYVNPDNIGYLSLSINTEAMANYYYKLIRQYLNSNPYTNQYSDIADVYMDLMEIIIDEKAIAELMPGNYIFVLHDMKIKTVNYTDYTYDDNFKSTEVKKTKQELSPNFTFVMETKKESFMKKIANLPLKYAKKENLNYQEKGGYYELAFEEGKYPISSLYFMVKDGKVIITTSKASIDMTLNNTAYTLDATTKNSILNNNYSLKLNTKKLIQQINPELSTDLSKKISKYLEENMGDIKMESSIKDGMIQGTTIMNITGTHANSLEFFFNMMDAMNDIMEKDKQEREKKID